MAREDIAVLNRIADTQWGLVTTAQAQQSGVERLTLSRLVKGGVLERVAQGVYRLSNAPHADNEPIKVAWISSDPEVLVAERLESPRIIAGALTAAYLWGCLAMQPTPLQFYTLGRKQTQRDELVYLQKEFTSDDVRIIDGLPSARLEFVLADLVQRDYAFSQLAELLKAIKDRTTCGAADAEPFDWEYLDRHLGTDLDKEWFSVWSRSTRILAQ